MLLCRRKVENMLVVSDTFKVSSCIRPDLGTKGRSDFWRNEGVSLRSSPLLAA